MQQSSIASLHSGLIERARPRAQPVGILKLRSANTTPPKVSGPIELPQARQKQALAPSPIDQPRRYGLTLRVDHEMRQELARFTEHTGRTMQSVLHSALSGYLHRANEILQHKE